MTTPGQRFSIAIKEQPMEQDNGSALVCKTPDGTLHEVFGCLNEGPPEKTGWKVILAIKAKVEGRVVAIFEQI